VSIAESHAPSASARTSGSSHRERTQRFLKGNRRRGAPGVGASRWR
jgi:hypothetical protein